MMEIICGNGPVVLVSDCDFDVLNRCHWYSVSRANICYAMTDIRKGLGVSRMHHYMHRLIMDPPAGMQVDHINGNGLDNRRENLRVATASQNRTNRIILRPKQSRYRGVSRAGDKSGKWVAYLKKEETHKYLGRFAHEDDAARAYDRAAREMHGDFALLNFPVIGEAGTDRILKQA